MTTDQTMARMTVLEAKLAEVQGHFQALGVMTDHLLAGIDRRDETIAALRAEVDQVRAENSRLRREERAQAEESWLDECRREGKWG